MSRRRKSRYTSAIERRAKADRERDAATRMTTQVAVAGVLIAFAVAIIAVLQGPAGFAPLAPLTRPLLGPITGLELIGAVFIFAVAFLMWRRLKR